METTKREMNTPVKRTDTDHSSNRSRKWMSVKEMGDLLGLRKTDRYWLVHKNVFATETMYGKMWVNVASFEKWYANQAKYRKVTGEEPGMELKEWSLSPRDISQMLEISEYRVYELIKEKNWKTITVDYRTRVLRDPFMEWYRNQKHYRTREDRLRDQELETHTITFPEAAAAIGLTRTQFYLLLKKPAYAHFFEIVEIAGRRRITKESFKRFLNGQKEYGLVRIQEPGNASKHVTKGSRTDVEMNNRSDGTGSKYLTVAEAAKIAHLSRQALIKYADQGCFGKVRQKNVVRIRRDEYEAWLKKRTGEATEGGID